MKWLHQTSFWESLAIQKRVVGALLMREVITRYGRNNIGFLWLFIEPLLLTFIIVLLWRFIRADRLSDLNIVAFILTGYPMAMMWRHTSSRAIGAISANAALLYHRNVRILDTLWSRMLLEVAGATIAQVVIIAALWAIDWIDAPYDVFYMLIAWLLMAWFAMGFGLIICAVAFQFDAFGKLWGTLSFVMLPISGAFFFVYSLPSAAREYALWIPMVHGTEMLRGGYFGPNIPTFENLWYLILCNLLVTLLGLALVKRFCKGIEAQ